MARPRAARASSRRRRQPRPASRPWLRPVLLAALAFALAVALHAALGAAGIEPEHPARLFLTPMLAAAVAMAGMGQLTPGRRVRLGLLVAAGLFLYSLLRAS